MDAFLKTPATLSSPFASYVYIARKMSLAGSQDFRAEQQLPPLPRIEAVVLGAAGVGMLSLMDRVSEPRLRQLAIL
ncbi:hypothetical protein C2W62_03905 [Candidatus Entotheonella serta]|nr:hypothetical protein C2W62_03905 [Candidatus Entotheonella serta]